MIDVSPFVETLNARPVGVFGLGVSGRTTVEALTAAGADVVAWDDKTGSPPESFEDLACLILSPGVPLYHPEPHPVVQAARAAGVEIICDVEVFARCNPGRTVVGITGTNGKSTTAALLHHVLTECGIDTQLGGNIGKAVLSLEMPPEEGAFVLELSSYQLDLCPTFSPDIAVLLNVTPDHLDRHGSMENYSASKAHIFEGSGEAVIATDDGYTKRIADDVEKKGARHVTRISSKDVDFETRALKGAHNQQNIAAVLVVANAMGLEESRVLAAIKSFPGLPHRQYPVRVIGDVTYINDSKATNAEATARALAAFDNIYWIVGGQAKEGGLKGLESYAPKIRSAFLIGESTPHFSADFIPFHQGLYYVKSNTLEQALKDVIERVAKDQEDGKSGPYTVLLSPACASWDQFESFEDRGDQFMELVNALPQTHPDERQDPESQALDPGSSPGCERGGKL